MLKNAKKQIDDIFSCIKYFGAFAWKERPIYYFYVILGIVIDSIGPFISIIGTRYLINEIVYDYNRDMKKIVFWAGFICIGTMVHRIIQKFANERQNYCNDQFNRIIQMQLSMSTMKMKFEYTENSKMLDNIKKAERAFEETNLVQGIADRLISIISNVIVLAGVFYLVIKCSVILLIPITFSFVVTSIVTMRNTKIREEYYAIYAEQTREQDYYMYNLTQGQYAKDIRVYDASGMILDNQKRMGENIYKVAKKYMLKQWKVGRVDTAITQICNIAIYIILGINTLLKKVLIGDFSSLVQSTIQFKDSMNNISEGIFGLRYTASVLKYFLEYMDMVAEEEEKEMKASSELPDITEAPTIEFRNVSFKYPNTDVYILKNISTTIHAGEHLSIVGQNGAGKTTFIKLLCRLYDVREGEILINGVNINRYRFGDYIKLLSVVFQDYKLMAFTIRENIALEESEDDGVKEKVKKLYNLIELDGWVNSLEKKDETNLYKMFDEAGVEPSGGQAQKLSIVRALYKNSPVVILDEPTAALDPVAEYEVYQHFDSLVGGKTAVYISHRLSSCRFCDRIIVFDGGKIIEDGSHEELMEIPNGFYANMYNTQAKHYN